MTMMRTTLLATAVTFGAFSTPAHAVSEQLLRLVSAELPNYVSGVDVNSLSNSQLATIYSIMHGPKSEGAKTGLIKSTLGGRNSIRSLFFK